ncbi:MAG: hypothetical protein ACRDRN_04550 [Sciscionella sp.]
MKTIRLDPELATVPLLTTWPAFTEAMYLLGRTGEEAGQLALWKLLLSRRLEIAELPARPQRRPDG